MAATPFPNRILKKFTKTLTFTGAAGLGATGTVAIATITDAVFIQFLAVRCTTVLAGATATIALGVAGNTAELIAQTTATDVDANEIWRSGTPDVGAGPAIVNYIVGLDIILTVATAAVDSGVLEFTAYWHPLEANGNMG